MLGLVTESLRVLLVGTRGAAGRALAETLRADERCGVVACARSRSEALALASEVQPHLIVISDRSLAARGSDGLSAVLEASPEARVFVLTDVSGALRADAHDGGPAVAGYLNRDLLSPDLGPALVDATLIGLGT
jgi:DNA-binding NarL/FixJ family response regulator